MKITLKDIGKQYKGKYIFQNIFYEFQSGEPCVILGPNASGKSTLINIISTHLNSTNGKVIYNNNGNIRNENVFRNISICSSYIELIEEFTIIENVDFFLQFKKLLKCTTSNDFININFFNNYKNKPISQLSSGIKQSVKLAITILADVPVVLLDEPCTNLDADGILWYKQMVSEHLNNRLFIVSSNYQKHEYEFCTNELHLKQFKF